MGPETATTNGGEGTVLLAGSMAQRQNSQKALNFPLKIYDDMKRLRLTPHTLTTDTLERLWVSS